MGIAIGSADIDRTTVPADVAPAREREVPAAELTIGERTSDPAGRVEGRPRESARLLPAIAADNARVAAMTNFAPNLLITPSPKQGCIIPGTGKTASSLALTHASG
jgi:hypothetical protein